MSNEQGAYQTPFGERELALYENLDLVLDQLTETYREHLWHVVWKLTGSDPAAFSAARRWLKAHDPAKLDAAIISVASSSEDAQEGEQ